MSWDERRSSPRIGASLRVVCRWGSGEAEGTTVNVSAGGVLLVMPDVIPAGTRMQISFSTDSGPVELRGLVRHAAEDLGHGIEFIEVLPSQRQALLGYLAQLQAEAARSDQSRGAAGAA